MGGVVRAEKEGAIGAIVFDHPERRNAVSVDMWRMLPGAVEELASDDEVRVVVMRGAGESAFVAGADISEFEQSRSGDAIGSYDADSARALDDDAAGNGTQRWIASRSPTRCGRRRRRSAWPVPPRSRGRRSVRISKRRRCSRSAFP